jgi:hypothetical protein
MPIMHAEGIESWSLCKLDQAWSSLVSLYPQCFRLCATDSLLRRGNSICVVVVNLISLRPFD